MDKQISLSFFLLDSSIFYTSIKNMDIQTETYKMLEFDKVKEKLSNFAKFAQSKNLCLNLLPENNIVKIKQLLSFTSESKFMLDTAGEIPIEFIADINKIKANSAVSYLSEEELVEIAKTLKSSRLLKNFIIQNSQKDSNLYIKSENLYSDKKLEDKIFSTFDENLNIKQTATPELKRLYTSLNDNEGNLKNSVSNLLNNAEFTKYLQDNIYTQRDDRVVFQVIASDKNKVPGLIHDVSASAKTFYIEPQELVPLNNKIREIKAKIRQECIKILVELSSSVKEIFTQLSSNEKIMAEIDFYFAKARYAIKLNSTEPEIDENTKQIYIEKMQHPLLLANSTNVIANDFSIGDNYNCVVITGSNTGGKTVTLKTIGLFIIMAKCGMFLPCTYAKLYPFKDVFADIGDNQSIAESLSTFSSHMKNIISILNKSNSESFILLDEICAGTDPVEGALLAKAILEKLSELGVTGVVTTHYGELKALEYQYSYFKNASVEFDTETLKPTYKLLIGLPGLSNAISIASNLGLDKSIVEKVKSVLISQKDPSIEVVERLQQTHQELSKNLEEAKMIKQDSLVIKQEYEQNLNKIKQDKKKTIKNIKTKFDNEILEAKAEIKEILEELRKEKSEKLARRAYSRLGKLDQKFRQSIENTSDKVTFEKINWDNIKIGDNLMLKNLFQKVTVISLPDKNKRLFVDLGSMKMKVKIDELTYLDENYKEPVKNSIPGVTFKKFELKKYNISQTLDLRGYRVEEALDEVENYLDTASLANLSPVFIIHGHGTGALKQAVREYLNNSPYVSTYRPGNESEGGDGVCVVDIK